MPDENWNLNLFHVVQRRDFTIPFLIRFNIHTDSANPSLFHRLPVRGKRFQQIADI